MSNTLNTPLVLALINDHLRQENEIYEKRERALIAEVDYWKQKHQQSAGLAFDRLTSLVALRQERTDQNHIIEHLVQDLFNAENLIDQLRSQLLEPVPFIHPSTVSLQASEEIDYDSDETIMDFTEPNMLFQP